MKENGEVISVDYTKDGAAHAGSVSASAKNGRLTFAKETLFFF